MIITLTMSALMTNEVRVLMKAVMKTKKLSKRKKNIVTKTKPLTTKQKKKQQKGIIDYINS